MVDRISAADNLTIEMQDDRWRLIANGSSDEQTVVEAEVGKPLRYIAQFGRTRRLPETGSLPVEHIHRVVLGWSQQDEAWHLGFVLNSELAQARGSRWCEVAHWPDPESNVFNDIALRAGRSLAMAVTRPFYLVPPQPAAHPAPAVPTRALPEPPIKLDLWTFERAGEGRYQLVRSKSWALTSIRRVLWYTLWTIVYGVLVYTTFTAGIAPARPAFLPYLGIASAAILVVLILKNLYQLLTKPNRFVIDGKGVRALVGRRERWRLAAGGQIQSVYVSQVIGRGKRGRAAQYGELNLQLQNNRFRYILTVEQTVDMPTEADEAVYEDAVVPLTADNAYTPLQVVGVYMAQALGVPCYHDVRLAGAAPRDAQRES